MSDNIYHSARLSESLLMPQQIYVNGTSHLLYLLFWPSKPSSPHPPKLSSPHPPLLWLSGFLLVFAPLRGFSLSLPRFRPESRRRLLLQMDCFNHGKWMGRVSACVKLLHFRWIAEIALNFVCFAFSFLPIAPVLCTLVKELMLIRAHSPASPFPPRSGENETVDWSSADESCPHVALASLSGCFNCFDRLFFAEVSFHSFLSLSLLCPCELHSLLASDHTQLKVLVLASLSSIASWPVLLSQPGTY